MIEAKPLHDQKITEIEGGAFHSLVLTENGDLYSFGTGWVGQLGQGNLAELEKLPQKVNADWIWLSQELND
jgi:alpha-tubulin suppressor-like RCC1 family protein